MDSLIEIHIHMENLPSSYFCYNYFTPNFSNRHFSELLLLTAYKISQHGNWPPYRIRKIHTKTKLIKFINKNQGLAIDSRRPKLLSRTAWKVFKYGVFSSPYFPVFGLNTEIYRSKSAFFLENTDQKKLRIWALFTQWRFHRILLTDLVCQRKNFPEEIFLGGSFPEGNIFGGKFPAE